MSADENWAYDTFISHSSDDFAEAEKLVQELEARGLRCWIAPRDLPVGDDYAAQIIRGIEASKTMTVLLTRHSIASPNVRREVEYMSRLKRLFLPIALESVEPREGLAFFLSSSHRIALYEGSRDAHLDRIAERIRHGQPEAAEPVEPLPPLPPPIPRWAIVAGTVVATVIMLLLGISSFNSWQSQRTLNNLTAGSRAAVGTDLSKVREKDVDLEIQARWFGGDIDMGLILQGALARSMIQTSTDGKNFAPTGSGVKYSPNERLFFRLAPLTGDGKPSRGFEITDRAREVSRKAIADALAGNKATNAVACKASECEIDRRELCGRWWTQLTLGRSPRDRDEFSYDLQNCPGSEVRHVEACIPVPKSIFPMRPDQTLYGALHLDGDDPYEFEMQVAPAELSNVVEQGKPWIELEPVDPKTAPFAAAWYDPTHPMAKHAFRIALGVGDCRYTETFRSVLFDVDGRGLTAGPTDYVSIPEPSRDRIEFAVDTPEGERFGPFAYRFDPLAVLQARIDASPKPVLACERSRLQAGGLWQWVCEVPSGGVTVIPWAKVRSIRYGSAENRLDQEQRIDLDPAKVLELSQARFDHLRPLVRISPPLEWTDFYFAMTYVDGSETGVQRVSLRD